MRKPDNGHITWHLVLVHRKNGGGRCVRVYHQNGRYGLAPADFPFSSLEELVQFYRLHSLASFNKRLDIFLKGAVCRVR